LTIPGASAKASCTVLGQYNEWALQRSMREIYHLLMQPLFSDDSLWEFFALFIVFVLVPLLVFSLDREQKH
ncbi:MAG: hypothetical protein QOD00_4018, partial [Blastocatellia bacterium]|nr:hypothetical protein [Blastocatellia bacterium]